MRTTTISGKQSTLTSWFAMLSIGGAIVLGACSKDEEPADTAATATAAVEEPKPEEKADEEAKAEEKDEAKEDEAEEKDEDGKAEAADAKDEAKAEEGAEEDKKAEAPKSDTKATPKDDKKEEAGYTGPKPCKKTKFAFGSVKSACNKGGQDAAKSLMKTYTKKGKDKGFKWKCSTCHSDTKSYANKPNAVSELKKIF